MAGPGPGMPLKRIACAQVPIYSDNEWHITVISLASATRLAFPLFNDV
jgi:hypothetical protein